MGIPISRASRIRKKAIPTQHNPITKTISEFNCNESVLSKGDYPISSQLPEGMGASGKNDLLATSPDGKHWLKGTTDIVVVPSPYVMLRRCIHVFSIYINIYMIYILKTSPPPSLITYIYVINEGEGPHGLCCFAGVY